MEQNYRLSKSDLRALSWLDPEPPPARNKKARRTYRLQSDLTRQEIDEIMSLAGVCSNATIASKFGVLTQTVIDVIRQNAYRG